MNRRTLAAAVDLSGAAVRTHGGQVSVELRPGNEGLVFIRADLGTRFPATLEQVVTVPNATALGRDGRPEVLFVEHVLSALVGLGYTDAEIVVEGPEIPLLDGSAQPFVEALQRAGAAELPGEVEPLTVTRPIWYVAEGQCLAALPAAEWSVDYSFEHAHPLIAWDHAHFSSLADYATAIAPARTFITAEEVTALQAQGLLQGGSEENARVVYPDRFSAPARVAHECAAHKVLDLIGDLALLGRPLQARLVAWRTGHHDNHALARLLQAV
ncbi:MAG: UDP-3-O-acyl-N-acetylglucosamine deacetylase [Armatimonadetes bacterium]|nr:UDP-3-O-acyl-N-acetylglucosamine deacetylase [Armatimonadota bacterium]